MEESNCSISDQRTYTAEQVAQILGVSVRKAYYLCESTTEFKVIRLGKRCIRIHKESFDKWFNGYDAST
jgi:excisionase family DNA binding protein